MNTDRAWLDMLHFLGAGDEAIAEARGDVLTTEYVQRRTGRAYLLVGGVALVGVLALIFKALR